MRFRDRVVFGVLVTSTLVAAVLWHPVGRWAALAVIVAGVLISAVVYRLPPPAFGLHDTPRIPGVTDAAKADPDPSLRQ